METFDLSPDGPKSIAHYRTLEQAVEQATAHVGHGPERAGDAPANGPLFCGTDTALRHRVSAGTQRTAS